MGIMMQRWLDEPADEPVDELVSIEDGQEGDIGGEVYEHLETMYVMGNVNTHAPSSLFFGIGAWAEEDQEENEDYDN
jgi:hypothetical protein